MAQDSYPPEADMGSTPISATVSTEASAKVDILFYVPGTLICSPGAASHPVDSIAKILAARPGISHL
jgi:hypothetical protein